MTSTNPITQAATSANTTQPKSAAQTLGKDDFLKLLVGQLQHQDPLAPSDDQQWIGQMAAFSQLEQVSN
ncbi:MAG: flagellar basal-body rod modification protein FlgD, partial [Thermoleophilaceae bacterium]|nr:flagellar basal-body rod modification protein FlgD [Thermoleophilaceae bacterium]